MGLQKIVQHVLRAHEEVFQTKTQSNWAYKKLCSIFEGSNNHFKQKPKVIGVTKNCAACYTSTWRSILKQNPQVIEVTKIVQNVLRIHEEEFDTYT